MATIYTGINQSIDPFQARIFADGIDVHDAVFVDPAFTPPHTLRPCTRFQWIKDGDDIAGATSDTFTVDVSTVASSGVYRCRITIGDDPMACITELTEERTVSIVDCGTDNFTYPPGGGTMNVVVTHWVQEVPTFNPDASWLSSDTSTHTVGTPDNVTTSTFTVVAAPVIMGARTSFGTVQVGGFSCIIGFAQTFPPAIPPPATNPIVNTPDGPSILRIENDGPSALAAACSEFTITYQVGGSFGLNYVTCIGEDGFFGFSGSSMFERSITVTANNDLTGTITFDNINVATGSATAADFTITSVPIDGFAAVIITPVGGIVDDPGVLNLDLLEFAFSINGVTIARNDGTTAPDRGSGTPIEAGVEAYYLFPENERALNGESRGPVILIAEQPGTWDLDIVMTLGDFQATATETFVVQDVAAARTNGVVTGDTTGNIGCGDTLSGTFQVTEGTASAFFETAGVALGTNSSDPTYLTQNRGDFTYTVTGGNLPAPVTSTFAVNNNVYRRVGNLALDDLQVGTYQWTISFADGCFSQALGRIIIEGNTFF